MKEHWTRECQRTCEDNVALALAMAKAFGHFIDLSFPCHHWRHYLHIILLPFGRANWHVVLYRGLVFLVMHLLLQWPSDGWKLLHMPQPTANSPYSPTSPDGKWHLCGRGTLLLTGTNIFILADGLEKWKTSQNPTTSMAGKWFERVLQSIRLRVERILRPLFPPTQYRSWTTFLMLLQGINASLTTAVSSKIECQMEGTEVLSGYLMEQRAL